MTPASVNLMLKWQITIKEQKVLKYKTCQDVETGIHNILYVKSKKEQSTNLQYNNIKCWWTYLLLNRILPIKHKLMIERLLLMFEMTLY